MKNSAILNFVIRLYKRLYLYYSYSGIYRLAGRWPAAMKQFCQGSGICHFFLKRWKTDTAWKNSFSIVLLLSPLRLFRALSLKTACLFKNHIEGSALVNGTVRFLDSIFNTSTRIYGLFLLAFTVTEGALWIILKVFVLKYFLLRVALLIVAVLLILVNRTLKVLYNGSFIGRLITDFFVVRGIENATDDK